MQLDTRVILAGQPVNGVNALAQGQLAGAAQQQRVRDQEYRNALAQYGPGAAAGDQAALGQLSRFEQFGPQQGAAIRQGDQSLAQSEERLRLAREEARLRTRELVRQMDQQQIEQTAEQLGRFGQQLITVQDEATWNRLLTENGFDPQANPFGERDTFIVGLTGSADALYEARGQQAEAAAGYPQSPMVQVNTGESSPRMGTVPQGYAAVEDSSNPSGYRLVPIPGGPEDTSEFDAQASANYDRKFEIVDSAINKALSDIEQYGRRVAGYGSLLSALPESRARDFQATIDTIRANLGFEELQQMRDSSPTGGALGQVTEREIAFLQAIQGNLDTAQSPEQLESVLRQIRDRRAEFRAERMRIMGQAEQSSQASASPATDFSAMSEIDLMQVDLSTLSNEDLQAYIDAVGGM